MSLFDERQQFATQFNFHQVDYHNRQQQRKAQDSSQTRWVVQPKRTNEQALYGEFLASNIFHSSEVLRQLSFGVGAGVGTSYPLPQPGTTVTVLNVGNQKYTIGAQTLASKIDFLHTLTRAKANPGLALPSPLAPAIKSAAGHVSTRAICSQGDLESLSKSLEPVRMPASLATIDPFTTIESSITPIETNAFIQNRNICSITPMSSITQQWLARQQLLNSAAVVADVESKDLYNIDPVDKATARVDIPNRTRESEFKLQVLTALQEQVQGAIGVEAGRKAAYPVLYELSNAAWTDPSLKEAFGLIAQVEQNPSFLQAKEILAKVNRYLPVAQKIAGVLFPPATNQLSVTSNGADTNLNTLTIKPNYQSEIARINKFLPLKLQLTLSLDQDQLKLGSFTANLETSFDFNTAFVDYVTQINTYLPADLDWIWGLGQPPIILIICKGLAISKFKGLLVADQALDAKAIVAQNLNCASTEVEITPVTTPAGVEYSLTQNQPQPNNNSQLQSDLLAAVPNLLQFKNGKLDVNRLAVAGLQEKILNTVLPSALQLKLEVNDVGYFSKINLGPLQATRTTSSSWTLEVPSSTKLLGGLDILDTIGVIPPSLKFLREAAPQLASIYAEHKSEFIDALSGQDPVGELLDKTLSKFSLDYTTGIKLEQLPPPVDYGPNPEPKQLWSQLSDVQQTLASPGIVDEEALRTFTERPTLNGNFLPLLSYAEEQFNSRRNAPSNQDELVKLGRSTSGVSIRTGEVPTITGANYSLLASLCTDNQKLDLPTEPELFALPAKPEADPVLSSFDYTKDYAATPPEVAVTDTLDPQSSRDALEAQLIETGLGEIATRILSVLDTFVYPPTLKFVTEIVDSDGEEDLVAYVDYTPEEFNSIFIEPNPLDRIERELEPISEDLEPSVLDLINVIQAAGDLGTQQVLAGLLVAAFPQLQPENQIQQVVDRRFQERLDCDSVDLFTTSLNQIKTPADFVPYAQEYGVVAKPALTYITQPETLLDLIDQVEPRLGPAIEQLLTGNLFGFFQQLIWAKTKADIYNSPLAYLALATNVRSYYGGAVPSSRPVREWLKEISK
jgi:hypothetical protein